MTVMLKPVHKSIRSLTSSGDAFIFKIKQVINNAFMDMVKKSHTCHENPESLRGRSILLFIANTVSMRQIDGQTCSKDPTAGRAGPMKNSQPRFLHEDSRL